MKTVLFGLFSIFLIIPDLNSIDVDVKLGGNLEICCKLKSDSIDDGLYITVSDIRVKLWWQNKSIDQDYAKLRTLYPDLDVILKDGTFCIIKSQATSKDDKIKMSCSVLEKGVGATLKQEDYTFRVFEELKFVTKLNEVLKVKVGDSIKTDCTATGSPDLQVLWRTKDAGKMSTGTSTATLDIPTVTVDMNGNNYTCEASISTSKDNIINQTIKLDVQYKPEMDIQTLIVHTDVGTEESFKINVKGNPQPKIECPLLNIQVNRIVGISSTSPFEYDYEMKIDKVTENHIGNYACTASNELGSVTKNVVLSVKPENLQVTSPNETSSSNCYILSWKMNSKAPIVNFTIATKVVNKNDSMISQKTIRDSEFKSIIQSPGNSVNNWENIFSYSFQNLTSERSYVISLQACNRHQCVILKDIVHFKTPISNGDNKCDPNKLSASLKTDDPSKTSWNLKPTLLFVITQSTTMLFIPLVLQQIY